MKENAKLILGYVQAHDGEEMTANSIGDALGLGVKQVVGTVNAYVKAIEEGEKARPAYLVRVPGTQKQPDGTVKNVNFIKLTADGKTLDLNASAE